MEPLFVVIFFIMLITFFAIISACSEDDVNSDGFIAGLAVFFAIIMIFYTVIIAGNYVEDYYKLGWIDGKTGGQQYELISNPDSTKTWEKK